MAQELSPEKQAEMRLASHWRTKFKEAMVAKAPFTKKWNKYFDAYKGDYFRKSNLPDYKSNVVANYIFSIVETIRPIMLDNDPKFQAMPRNDVGLKYAEDINKALMYEWDREMMNEKLYRELVNGLVTGNYFFYVPFDMKDKQVKAVPVSPFNIFPDPLARTIETSEYIIYADYYNAEYLKKVYPDRADELIGSQANMRELINDALSPGGSEENQILILEVYSRDHVTHISDKTGKPVLKYPNGRVTTVAPDLGLILQDKANPYKDDLFPFVHGKDYDVPHQFWGEGEVAQLMSPQGVINELNNAIIDNAKATANMPWVIDRNSGIKQGSITNRPGLVIRKNPGSEVRRDQPPSMPAYVNNAVNEAKGDMEQISGIFDTLKGNSETGVYTAQGILALQEAGQARIRLKVKLLENTLGKLGQLWYSRIKQFWDTNKWVRITLADGTYDFKKLSKKALEEEYDIRIVAGSTLMLNRNAMLDLMIRLAQTQLPDGQALVDREAVAEFLPQEVKSSLLKRSQEGANAFQGQIDELTQAFQQSQAENQQFQQEISQTIQQLVQESQQNDQQTLQAIQNIVSTLEGVNKKIVQLEEYVDQKEKATEEEQKSSEAYDRAYNEGFRDAESNALQADEDPLDGGLSDDGLTEGEEFSETEANQDLPSELLQGLESLSDDELALLRLSDPTVGDLV